MLRSYISFFPKDPESINNHVAIYCHDEKIEFFTPSSPIYSCQESDLYGLRLAQGIIVTQNFGAIKGVHCKLPPVQCHFRERFP